MGKNLFKSAVIHDGKLFITGEICPDHLNEEMAKKDLIHPIVEAVKPGESLKPSDAALKEAMDQKAKAAAQQKQK